MTSPCCLCWPGEWRGCGCLRPLTAAWGRFRACWQVIALELVMVATSAVEREFREINQRTEVGTRWSDPGVERVARLLEEVRLNGTRLEFDLVQKDVIQ